MVRNRVIILTLMISLAGCAAPSPKDGSLYVALGEMPGIEELVKRLLDRVTSDDRIALMFDPENRDYLHDRIVEQVCEVSGGPCEYTGLEMDEGHVGFEIRHLEFDAFVEDLILAMEELDIDIRAQNGLLAIFAPMRGDIVDR